MLLKCLSGSFVLFTLGACSGTDSQLDATNRPQKYRTLCRSGETCAVKDPTDVAFGAAGSFVHKVLQGPFLCAVETFGRDPAPAKAVKECSVPVAAETPSPPISADDDCQAGATIRDRTIDCRGKTIGLSCDADSESQPPVLTLINATVKNVRIAANGGSDGIHCVGGDCTLENVVWEDICEDAATHKSEGGTMTIVGGSVYNDAKGPGGKPDKIFQHNSRNSTTVITGGFTVNGQNGKLWRSCGDCRDNGGPRSLIIDDVRIEGTLTAGVAGANRNFGDRVKIRNLLIKDYPRNKPAICDEYLGVEKGQGSSQKFGEFFETATCDVRREDVSGY